MNFDEFVTKIMTDMKENNPEYEMHMQNVDKLQGQSYRGMAIKETGQNVSITINLDQAYEQLQEGADYRTVLGKIELAVKEGSSERPDFDFQLLSNYEKMAETLVMQMVPVEGNEELLAKVPHQVTGDIATVYRFQIEKDSKKAATILITNQMLENYNITPEQLHSDAQIYAPQNEPPAIKSMADMLSELAGMDVGDGSAKMYVATVASMINGAAVINYPGFLEKVAEMIHGDFYVLPSSINEVLFMKDDGNINAQNLNEMISSINENEVRVDERLSNNAYRYDSQEKILELATDFEKRMETVKEMEQEESIKVLLVEPGKYPTVVEIGKELEDLQTAVGGYIEEIAPFEDPVILIMNEEGKINGGPLNRALRDLDGDIYDVVAGPFLVVGVKNEDLSSLTSEQIGKYEKLFHQPETFIQTGRSIIVVPVPDEIIQKNSEKEPVRNASPKVLSEDCR